MPLSSKKRYSPFSIAGKKRSRKSRNKTKKITQCDTERLHDFNKESAWFNQDNVEESTATSASAKKIRRGSSDDSDTDEEIIFSSNENWIVDMTVITNIFQEYCACRECGSKMPLEERKNERAGLTTKFALICSNKSCSFYTSPLYFHTTPKQGQSYDINKKSVLTSRLIDKGRAGFRKLCGVLGLTSPISKRSFATTTKFWENVTRDLKETKFQNVIEKVKSVKKDMILLLPILLMLQQVLMALGHRGMDCK